MNLRALANLVTSRINGNQTITWVQNIGYSINAAGKRTPNTISSTVSAQIQPVSGRDLMHMEGMNVQGVMRAVYMYGVPQGAVRADGKGGDILQFPESLVASSYNPSTIGNFAIGVGIIGAPVPPPPVRNWLVSQVLETWPDWSKVIVTLQAS